MMGVFYKPNNKKYRPVMILMMLVYMCFFVCALSGTGLADTEVIHPSGLYGTTTWDIYSSWASDLDSNGADDTYVAFTSGSSGQTFYVAMDYPSFPAASIINSVTVSFVARYANNSTTVIAGFRTDGATTKWDTDRTLNPDYETYTTQTWTVDSAGGDLDFTDIENLQVAMKRTSSGGSAVARVTEVCATIDYTVAILDWTGDAGFESDGVDPDSASSPYTFEFRVEYTNVNNDPPTLKQVWVDLDDSGTYETGEKFTMGEVYTGDTTYTDGKDYTYSTAATYSGDGILNYRFYFSDGTYEATGDPTIDHTFLVGNAPTLTWTGDAGFTFGVNPDIEISGSTFEFRVKYTDLDNDPPPGTGKQVWIDLDDDGNYETGEKFIMDEVDTGDTIYTNGKDYTKSITIYHPGGSTVDETLKYKFYFSYGHATGDPASDHTFTVEPGNGIYHVSTTGIDGTNEPYDSWDNAARNIQTAIDYAVAQDPAPSVGNEATVIVSTGTYSEAVTMANAVNVVSNQTPKPKIDSAGGRKELVSFSGSITCNLVGFEMDRSKGEGGAIFMAGPDAGTGITGTIANCDIHSNFEGAGIRLDGVVSPTITGCNIYNNYWAGIATSDWRGDLLESSSSITIKGNTIGGIGQGNGKAGIYLEGNPSASSTIQVTIGGSAASDSNTISHNTEAGIRLEDIGKVSIENNDISTNYKVGILLLGATTVSPHIRNNDIHNHTGEGGINIGGASSVTIGDNNNIYSNRAGVVFYVNTNATLDPGLTLPASSQPVTIMGNHIYTNTKGGIAVIDNVSGTITIHNNKIYQNTKAGIGIFNECTAVITDNEIYTHDGAAGIFTGDWSGTLPPSGTGFLRTNGPATLSIKRNKVYGNRAGMRLDHASGTLPDSGQINNNLVYGSSRGGIRFGGDNYGTIEPTDWPSWGIKQIMNNTVADNGSHVVDVGQGIDEDRGGGIIYDDINTTTDPITTLTRNFYDRPVGTTQNAITIKNNILANNTRAGIKYCADNSANHRSYNLFYRNKIEELSLFPATCDAGGSGECGKSCRCRTLGNCYAPDVNCCAVESWCYCNTSPLDPLNDWATGEICGKDPLFVDPDNLDYSLRDYTLQADSPAKTGGDGNIEMGAYGGPDPINW